MNPTLSWTLPWKLPWSITLRLRHYQTTPHRLHKNILLILLLVLPLLAVARNATPNDSQNNDTLTGTQNNPPQAQVLQGGFFAVDKQWCTFYPELPLCSGFSGSINIGQPAPPGTGWVPNFWCKFIPNLPPCDGGSGSGSAVTGPTKPLTGFGSNPGNLEAFKYMPANSGSAPRPLVVALHGCTQQASNYDDETGWVKLADKFDFALLLPQQKPVNNFLKCFRWFEASHNQRDRGEALSIKQMIDTMLADTSLNIDKKRVYVTGLSAGGAMTAVMMATYPEMFAGGAPIAGIPYGCAHSQNDAQKCGVKGPLPPPPPPQDLSPAEWGSLVRTASPSSTFPRVSIWHGTSDSVVHPLDAREMVEQWTNVLGLSQMPQVDETFKTTRHQVFQDSTGRPMVEAYFVNNMDHGTPIDPGSAEDQCGKSPHDKFIIEKGICSSFFIAKFWGLAPIIAEVPPAAPSPGDVMMSPFAPTSTKPASGN